MRGCVSSDLQHSVCRDRVFELSLSNMLNAGRRPRQRLGGRGKVAVHGGLLVLCCRCMAAYLLVKHMIDLFHPKAMQ